MVQFFDEIPEHLMTWIPKQQMFWVATAPLKADGHVNLSPKGLAGTFHIVNSNKVWYEDMCGSGVETIAHVRENGRITILFNAFDGPPRIARLFGTGTVYEFGTPEYDELIPSETRLPGSRSAIVIDVYKVATSCGYAVPYYSFKSHRTQLLEWSEKKEAVDRDAEIASPSTFPRPEKGLKSYWAKNNEKSLDGLPGLRSGHESNKIFTSASIRSEKHKASPQTQTRVFKQGFVDTKLLAGFSMGVLAAAAYVKLMA